MKVFEFLILLPLFLEHSILAVQPERRAALNCDNQIPASFLWPYAKYLGLTLVFPSCHWTVLFCHLEKMRLLLYIRQERGKDCRALAYLPLLEGLSLCFLFWVYCFWFHLPQKCCRFCVWPPRLWRQFICPKKALLSVCAGLLLLLFQPLSPALAAPILYIPLTSFSDAPRLSPNSCSVTGTVSEHRPVKFLFR